MHLGNIRQMHSPLVKPLLTRQCFSLQEKHTAIQIEKICKIIDSTNDFNRLKITYAFHSLFQSSLVCTCICSGMFRIQLGMSHRSGRGNFHKDSGNQKKNKNKNKQTLSLSLPQTCIFRIAGAGYTSQALIKGQRDPLK